MATEEQIKVLLRAAISPLDKKMDYLTTEFAELKRSVEFLLKSMMKLSRSFKLQTTESLNSP